MKGLRKFVDNIKPNFVKGGKFEVLESFFDSIETLLFVPNTTTVKGAHIRDSIDTKRTMIFVFISLMPAFLFGLYNTGLQNALMLGIETSFVENVFTGLLAILPMIIVSYGVGLGLEILFAQLRGHEVSEGFFVTGLLIPMVMPIDIPLWMVALATAFAVIFGKEVFGGTGMNIFNPALLARAFAFFAYTPYMSGAEVWVDGMGKAVKAGEVVDSYTGATALEQLVNNTPVAERSYSTMDAFLGFIPGSFGETSTAAILIGAAILLFTGIGSWRTMLSVFVGGGVMVLVFNTFGGDSVYMQTTMCEHFVVGGFAFGAVFMATDPVTSAQTNVGKYIVGFMTGAIAILIRVINPAYPEGMMLSILFMNALAPLVDYYVVEANIARRNKRIKTVKTE
ncbi:MAG: NADH:ubiquinone reductase (Na(+)-transporting) subunit B [Rikenellaceae bacterium]